MARPREPRHPGRPCKGPRHTFKCWGQLHGAVLHRFVVAPRRTGAVAPSSRHLARALATTAFRGEPRTVVEIGAGSGAVTRELARLAAQRGATLVAVEVEGALARRIPGGSAVQADARLLPVRRADVVVSGIPFASLRREEGHAILREAARVAPRIVLFQYTTRRLDLIEAHFPRLQTVAKVRRNLPPALVVEARVA